jgi:hypothetical protein
LPKLEIEPVVPLIVAEAELKVTDPKSLRAAKTYRLQLEVTQLTAFSAIHSAEFSAASLTAVGVVVCVLWEVKSVIVSMNFVVVAE